jgi:hypothetical protein
MSVTFRHTSTADPAKRSTRAATSAHTNVAAWPTWVVSYGVMPHTYTRARPRIGSRTSPIRREADPSAACALIVFAVGLKLAGETVDGGSAAHSRYEIPLR